MPENETTLLRGAAALGITLGPGQVEQFRQYYALLADWNARVNLTAVTEYHQVLARHFLDSLTVALVFPCLPASAGRPDDEPVLSLVDVGSGGGFPGLPLAIAFPQLRITLLEATSKKVAFLQEVSSRLGLLNVTALSGRAEEVAHQAEHRERYDVAVSRAVDALAVLAEYQLPLTRIGGVAVAMKKGDAGEEIAAAGSAVAALGGELTAPIPVDVPGLEEGRWLVVVRKTHPTPDRYPRRPGIPRKRPL